MAAHARQAGRVKKSSLIGMLQVQAFYVCGPGPVLLEYFNLHRIYYEVTAEPMKGWISHISTVNVALKVGDK